MHVGTCADRRFRGCRFPAVIIGDVTSAAALLTVVRHVYDIIGRSALGDDGRLLVDQGARCSWRKAPDTPRLDQVHGVPPGFYDEARAVFAFSRPRQGPTYAEPLLRLAASYVPSRAVAEEVVQDTLVGRHPRHRPVRGPLVPEDPGRSGSW